MKIEFLSVKGDAGKTRIAFFLSASYHYLCTGFEPNGESTGCIRGFIL